MFFSPGTVYVRWEERNLVIIPQNDVSHFIISAYLDSFNHYIAADGLINKLREYVYFENLNKFVREQIAKCGVWLQHQRLRKSTKKSPINIRDIPNFWGLVYMWTILAHILEV